MYANPKWTNSKNNTISGTTTEGTNNAGMSSNSRLTSRIQSASLVSSGEILAFLEAQENNRVSEMKLKGIDKNIVPHTRQELSENHLLKEDLLSMGFTEEEIDKYFISTQPRTLNKSGELKKYNIHISRYNI